MYIAPCKNCNNYKLLSHKPIKFGTCVGNGLLYRAIDSFSLNKIMFHCVAK